VSLDKPVREAGQAQTVILIDVNTKKNERFDQFHSDANWVTDAVSSPKST
jgi:hypothetical protein